MPSNLLLLLPLVGGYAFIHLCYFTRFRAQTLDGHRLIFEAAVWGFLFVAPARWLTRFWLGEISWLRGLWAELGGGTGYLGTLICALVLAAEARRREPVSPSPLLLDGAFLVRSAQMAGFENTVDRWAKRLSERACQVTLTGPWPPYNFIGEEAS